MEHELTLREYQRQAMRTNRVRGEDLTSIMVPLLGLAGEAGSLLTEYKKWLREGERYRPFTDQVSEEIGDILWYLATIAQREGLDLQEIAEENLAKLQDRWSPKLGENAERLDEVFHQARHGTPGDDAASADPAQRAHYQIVRDTGDHHQPMRLAILRHHRKAPRDRLAGRPD